MATNSSLSMRISENAFLRYVYAIAAAVAAILVSDALNPFVGDRASYIFLLPVAVAAWHCGIGPSLAAIALGIAGAMYGPITRLHPFPVPTRAELILIPAFLVSSFILVALAESRRRHNETLRKSQGELEVCVQQRTAELNTTNQNLRELSARLLRLQDEERRRIARELHDSVGQMLAALNMNLSAVRADVDRLAKTATALADSENLVQQMSSEVRTISHLLHPPLLDEAGLSSALRWYVDGFARRSKIDVRLEIAADFERIPQETELAIFRVVQECLTNIHRHSGSASATIALTRQDERVWLEIKDSGKGIPPEKHAAMTSSGVGLAGMRERVRQLGGILEIHSSSNGTVIKAGLPLAHGSENSAAEQVA
jgi:signal transduction histidine kinase